MPVDVDKFHERCGKLLRFRAAIESYLELLLSHYFDPPLSYKIDMDFAKMSLEQKKFLYRKICEREGIAPNKIQKIMSGISRIQKVGNSIAHHDSFIFDQNHPNIFMRPKKVSTKKSDLIEVTEELVKEIDAIRLKTFHSMNGIYVETHDKRRRQLSLYEDKK